MEWQSNNTLSVFGKKRSGKSIFVKTQVWPNLDTCILYDIKMEHYDLAKDSDTYVCHNVAGVQELLDRGVKKIVYMPYQTSQEDFNEVCEIVFYRGNCTIWADEIASIATPLKFPYYWGENMRLGAIRGIGVINVSQRPAMLPSLCISEADVVVSFRLQLASDAEKVATVMGEVYINELMHIPDYYFLVYDFKTVQRCSPLSITPEQEIEAGTIKGNEGEEIVSEEIGNEEEGMY